MKERPILFSGEMVRALLAGQKTQTRRVAKPVKHPDLGNLYDPGALVLEREPQHVIDRACPYGQPGDRLWVRETCRAEEQPSGLDGVRYLADNHFEPIEKSPGAAFKWMHLNAYRAEAGARVPSIHMPRWASRILLEVVSVRVERLNDCSVKDAIAEGAQPVPPDPVITQVCPEDYLAGYRHLWESINGAGSWSANPWVWVVEFRRVDP